MFEWFLGINPILQALMAGIFTWACTALGAALVFFVRRMDDKFLAIMQGLAGGVMTAASFWSLLDPAIEYGESGPLPAWIPAAIGFLLGGIFLRILDKVIPHLHASADHGDFDINNSKLGKNTMLFLAVTIHNFPEGMALGVAYAAAAAQPGLASMSGAIALTIGIGLQNFPEGSALSLPTLASGKSKKEAFNLGQLSAIIEPIGAVLGAWAVTQITALLPYALSFAAGAMIFVVVEELIPESQESGFTDSATLAFLAGFTLMMVLDVALG